VGPAGGTFPLSQNGQSTITFAPGAVTTQTTFTVNAVTQNDTTLAGVGFTPGIGLFQEPVLLRLSYNGCPGILAKQAERLHIVFKDTTGNWKPIEGGKSMQQHYVEAYVQHFTDFAIAL
jgi:hypothetical protein